MSAKKIGIIGTNCSGKTTFCYELLHALKMQGTNAVGIVDQDRNYTFPQEIADNNEYVWHGYIANQIQLETKAMYSGADIVICDRTPFDTYAYLDFLFNKPKAKELYDPRLWQYVADWCRNTYSAIYLLKPMPYKVDGIRQHDAKVRDKIYSRLLQVCDKYRANRRITNLWWEDDSQMQRADFIKKVLNDL